MADISYVTTPYEVLIRWSDDGKLQGAHQRRLRKVVVDGETLKVEELLPEALGIEDFPTSEIMQAATRDALNQVTSLRAENFVLDRRLKAAEKNVEDLNKRIAKLDDEAERLRAANKILGSK